MRSYQQTPSHRSKKRERAIKGKENKPDACSTGLFACERPRGRVGIRKRLIEAAVEDALRVFCGTRKRESGKPCNGRDARCPSFSDGRDAYCPSFSDEQLWAKFAWKFGWGLLRELTLQGEAEMREHRKPVEDRDKPKILQRLINGFWRRGSVDTEVAAVRTGEDNKRTTTGRTAGKEAK